MLESLLSLGLGMLLITRDKAEQMVDEMVKRGDIGRDEARETLNRIMERGREEQERLRTMIREESEKIISRSRFVTREDLSRLENRITQLERQINEQQQHQQQ